MPRSPIRPVNVLLVGALLASNLVLAVPGANAACHIAGFVEDQIKVDTNESRSVTLRVELQGRVESCEGTVDWATEDGTAKAGTDYLAASGTLTFVAGDDRIEDITIEIIQSGGGDFQVVLSNPTGSITGTGDPATVSIVVDDIQVQSEPRGVSEPEPTDDATTPAATEPTTTTDTADAASDGAGFPWIPLLAVVIVLGLLVGWYIARRTPTHPEG